MCSGDPFDQVCALADVLTSTLRLAGALQVSGRLVDLTGFDRQVGLLCAKSLDLPPDQGRRMRPRLVALSQAIDALTQVLAARPAASG